MRPIDVISLYKPMIVVVAIGDALSDVTSQYSRTGQGRAMHAFISLYNSMFVTIQIESDD